VTGGWRQPYKEEPRELYSSPRKIRITKVRRIQWVGHIARMGKRYMYKLYVGIKLDLVVIGLDDVDWIIVAQDTEKGKALVNVIMKILVP
jgi:hypothetical protein